MKRLRVIWLVALVLAVFSGQVFAGDDLLNQLRSGINGLSKGDYSGVALGVSNFALGTKTTSQLSNQLQSGISGMRAGNFSGVALGMSNFALGTGITSQLSGLGAGAILQINNLGAGMNSAWKGLNDGFGAASAEMVQLTTKSLEGSDKLSNDFSSAIWSGAGKSLVAGTKLLETGNNLLSKTKSLEAASLLAQPLQFGKSLESSRLNNMQ
jgi:hypothetical protein